MHFFKNSRIYRQLWICFAILASSLAPAWSADGDLDPTFDAGAFDIPYGAVAASVRQPDGKLVISGNFRRIGGVVVNGIARINVDGSLDETFVVNMEPDNQIRTMDVQSDGKIVIGGRFSSVDGIERISLARLGANGALDQAFDAQVSGDTLATTIVNKVYVLSDDQIMIDGLYRTVGSETRTSIAKLSADGVVETAFNPDMIGIVRAFAEQSDNKLLIGGSFRSVNDADISYLARLEQDGTTDETFDPQIEISSGNSVYDIAIDGGGNIVFGGQFERIAGLDRRHLARVDVTGSLDQNFNPDPDDQVDDILIASDGSTIFSAGVGGFSAVAGITRASLARVASDGTLDQDFDPNPSGNIYDLLLEPNGNIVVMGDFGRINATSTSRIAKITLSGNLISEFVPALFETGGGIVYASAVQSDNKSVIGGFFSSIDGVFRNGIARLNSDGSLDLGFAPSSKSNVTAIAIQEDGKILIAGRFDVEGEILERRITRLMPDGTVDETFNAVLFGEINSIALQADGKILVGGSIISSGISSPTKENLVRLHQDGRTDAGFRADPNGTVHTIVIQPDGQILLGGEFTEVRDLPRNRIARVNSFGRPDETFSVDVNGFVRSIALDLESGIWIGGGFSSVNAEARLRIAKLHSDGSLNTEVIANANRSVNALHIQPDNKLLVAGIFSTIGENARNRLARLMPDGEIDPGFTADTLESVRTLSLQSDDKILVGAPIAQPAEEPDRVFNRLENTLPSVFTVEIETAEENEGNLETTDFEFKVLRQGGVAGISSVSYVVVPGTVNPVDENDVQGGFPTGTLVFSDGEAEKNITVNILGDDQIEENETIDVRISLPVNAIIIGDIATAVVVNDEFDQDNDEILDRNDNCISVSNPDQLNNDNDAFGDICDFDDDNDSIADGRDNCPFDSNRDQADNDEDDEGDICDVDDDNDSVLDLEDICPFNSDPFQENDDDDLLGNACDPDDDNDSVADELDNCQSDANPDQKDTDGDLFGDVCDLDDDGDLIPDFDDNCPLNQNFDQSDTNGDDIGDVCDPDTSAICFPVMENSGKMAVICL